MRKGKKRLRLQLDPVHSCFFWGFFGMSSTVAHPVLLLPAAVFSPSCLADGRGVEWQQFLMSGNALGPVQSLLNSWVLIQQNKNTGKTRGKNQLNWVEPCGRKGGDFSSKNSKYRRNFVIFPFWSHWKFDIWSCPSTEFKELKSKPCRRWKICGGLVCYWCLVKRVWEICYFNLVQVKKWIGMNFCCVPATKMGGWSQNIPSLILCAAKQSLLSKYLEELL